MKPARLATLTLAIALAITTLTATTATAATKKAEFVGSKNQSLAGTTFKTEAIGKTVFETTGGAVAFECETATGSGEIISTISATEHLLFRGCENALRSSCTSPGSPKGELQFKEILLDVVKSPGGQTDLLLVKLLKTVECTMKEVSEQFRGSLLVGVPAKDEDKLANVFSFTANRIATGKNEFTKYENTKGELITNFLEMDVGKTGWTQLALTDTTELTLAGKLEGEFI